MTFDLKAQPASISSAICGLRRIIIVFSFLFKLIKWNGNGNGIYDFPTLNAVFCLFFFFTDHVTNPWGSSVNKNLIIIEKTVFSS